MKKTKNGVSSKHIKSSDSRLATIKSLYALDDNIFLMDYQNDYCLNELLSKGVSNVAELTEFAAGALTFGKKVKLPDSGRGEGCSSFDARTPQGAHLLARNFDFKTAPCFAVWTHPKGFYSSISVVDGNFMLYGSTLKPNFCNSYRVLLAPYCCVDGMNECGLAVSVLQLRAKATWQTDPDKKDIITTVMIRGLLDTCADVGQAIDFLLRYNMHDSLWTNYHYQIVDRSGRSIVAEYIDNKLRIYERGSTDYPAAGSVFENDGLSFQYAANYSFTEDVGAFEIEQHGEDRAQAIKKVLGEKKGVLTELEAMDLLNYVKLDYKHSKYPWRIGALWSIVYNVTDGTAKIAANMDYKNIYTFSIGEPCRVLKTEAIEKSAYFDTNWSH